MRRFHRLRKVIWPTPPPDPYPRAVPLIAQWKLHTLHLRPAARCMALTGPKIYAVPFYSLQLSLLCRPPPRSRHSSPSSIEWWKTFILPFRPLLIVFLEPFLLLLWSIRTHCGRTAARGRCLDFVTRLGKQRLFALWRSRKKGELLLTSRLNVGNFFFSPNVGQVKLYLLQSYHSVAMWKNSAFLLSGRKMSQT